MPHPTRILPRALALLLAASPAAAGVTEGAVAPPGDCARAPELPPAGPVQASISSLFPPLDVAGGGGPGGGAGAGGGGGLVADPTGSGGPPGRPDAQVFTGPGACDVPGSGCAGPSGASLIPPGGVVQPDGWIRFPDGSLIPPPGTNPTGVP